MLLRSQLSIFSMQFYPPKLSKYFFLAASNSVGGHSYNHTSILPYIYFPSIFPVHLSRPIIQSSNHSCNHAPMQSFIHLFRPSFIIQSFMHPCNHTSIQSYIFSSILSFLQFLLFYPKYSNFASQCESGEIGRRARLRI